MAAAIVILPILGTCLYLIVRPATATYRATTQAVVITEQAGMEPGWRPEPSTAAAQLASLSALVARGRLTPAEFEAEKARILGRVAAPTPTAPAGAGTTKVGGGT